MLIADTGVHNIRAYLRGRLHAKNHTWGAYVNKSSVFNDSCIPIGKHDYLARLQNCAAIVGDSAEAPNRDVPSFEQEAVERTRYVVGKR